MLRKEVDEWIKHSIEKIKPYCSANELKGISSRVNSTCEKEFSQGISELVVSKFFLENYPDGILIPRGTKAKKDIDVSFMCSGKRVNVEVKCPDLSFNKTKDFTAHFPYVFDSKRQFDQLKLDISHVMSGNIDLAPNKILNLGCFFRNCDEKFKASAKVGDINVIFFSMLDVDWMDKYFISITSENFFLKNRDLCKNIHAVVLSDLACCHKADGLFLNGLQDSLSLIIYNHCMIKDGVALDLLDRVIPNKTKEFNAWYKVYAEQRSGVDRLASDLCRIKLFHESVHSFRYGLPRL